MRRTGSEGTGPSPEPLCGAGVPRKERTGGFPSDRFGGSRRRQRSLSGRGPCRHESPSERWDFGRCRGRLRCVGIASGDSGSRRTPPCILPRGCVCRRSCQPGWLSRSTRLGGLSGSGGGRHWLQPRGAGIFFRILQPSLRGSLRLIRTRSHVFGNRFDLASPGLTVADSRSATTK